MRIREMIATLRVLIVKQEKGIEKMNTDVKLLKITH